MSSDNHVFNTEGRSFLIKFLRVIASALPGDYLKTFVYLNLIDKPRRAARLSLNTFYRIDHVYAVLQEFAGKYRGRFSVLEFGTSDGYAFTKILFATKYLKLENRITVHTFDSFEGMPPAADAKDLDVITGNSWVAGEFKGRYQKLLDHCKARYSNFQIHKGMFAESLTDQLLRTFRSELPVLVWFDCDYYSSARVVFERLLPHLPNGCVLYFDEYEQLNFGSRFTGEARLVHEINSGVFGADIELVPDSKLSLDTKRIYRFVRTQPTLRYESISTAAHTPQLVHWRGNDSAFP